MKIVRINDYNDERFSKIARYQHGCFLIDGSIKCEFIITDFDSATIYCSKDIILDEVIDEFRYYAEQITKFYDKDQRLIKEFPKMDFFYIDIDLIQPSQFFVNKRKLDAIRIAISNIKDIIIPVTEIDSTYVSCDGHTRLLLAKELGVYKIKVHKCEYNELTKHFVEEAKRRGIKSINDVKVISQELYEIEWIGFCNEFIASFKNKIK